MKLYYSKGACSLVVRIIINELDISCEYEAVDLKVKKTASQNDFLSINPKGAVPALEIETKEILTENAVILQYLADVYKANYLLPLIGNFKRYRTLEWLNFISTELHKGFGPLFNKEMPDEVKNKIPIPNLQKKFAYINDNLKTEFIMGKEFSLPDAYLFVMLFWAYKLNVNLNNCQALKKYYEHMQKRKSIMQAFKEENLFF